MGERLLFLRSPNIRGDDVAELQSMLNRLGFDCGRVDGIFGPLLVRAISDFQQNIGVDSNGICTPELVDVLRRVSLQTGTGPGIAVVREGIELETQHSGDSARIVIGYFHGGAGIAHAVVNQRILRPNPQTAAPSKYCPYRQDTCGFKMQKANFQKQGQRS